MTREQAQAYMRRLSKEERKLLEELMEALSPRGETKAAPADRKDKKRKEK